MPRLRTCFVALALALAPARAAVPPPAGWKLPPLDGELAGEFDATMLGGAPRLKWKLTLRTEKPRERFITFAITGHGLRLEGDARVDPMGEGQWRLTGAEIDLGVWYPWLTPYLPTELAGLVIAGILTFDGEGTWRGHELAGRAHVALRDGRIDNAKRKAWFDGVALSLEITDLQRRITAPSQLLTWKNGHYDVVDLGTGRIEFSLDGDRVSIAQAAIKIFGGELAVRSVSYSLKNPEFSVSAQMTGVELSQLIFLLPNALSKASGSLDGYVDLMRDANGIAIGAGYLGLREGVKATLQFVPTPGILSAALPPAINKLYPGISQMETAGIPLLAEDLKIRFEPEGDEQGRTAWLHVAGRPVDPMFKGPIDLTMNVRGPLEQVFNMGANSALRLMGR